MKGGRGEGREIGQEGRKEGRKEGVTLVHLPVPNTCQNYVENNKSHLEGEKKRGGKIPYYIIPACTMQTHDIIM